jgi:hypothetical protein
MPSSDNDQQLPPMQEQMKRLEAELVAEFCRRVDDIMRRADAYDFLAAHHDSPDYACGRDLKD